MEKTIRLNADQREDLVAYLDGELSDEKVREIDQVIARSEVARHEVEALSRTFELLDVLPVMQASNEFAGKTLTNLKVVDEPYQISDQWWYSYLTRTAAIGIWMISLTACAWVGYQLTARWVPNHNDEILNDFQVIESLHDYRQIGDFEFLKQMKQQGLFDENPEK